MWPQQTKERTNVEKWKQEIISNEIEYKMNFNTYAYSSKRCDEFDNLRESFNRRWQLQDCPFPLRRNVNRWHYMFLLIPRTEITQ